jgi:hypothetical protein
MMGFNTASMVSPILSMSTEDPLSSALSMMPTYKAARPMLFALEEVPDQAVVSLAVRQS